MSSSRASSRYDFFTRFACDPVGKPLAFNGNSGTPGETRTPRLQIRGSWNAVARSGTLTPLRCASGVLVHGSPAANSLDRLQSPSSAGVTHGDAGGTVVTKPSCSPGRWAAVRRSGARRRPRMVLAAVRGGAQSARGRLAVGRSIGGGAAERQTRDEHARRWRHHRVPPCARPAALRLNRRTMGIDRKSKGPFAVQLEAQTAAVSFLGWGYNTQL